VELCGLFLWGITVEVLIQSLCMLADVSPLQPAVIFHLTEVLRSSCIPAVSNASYCGVPAVSNSSYCGVLAGSATYNCCMSAGMPRLTLCVCMREPLHIYLLWTIC